jgi:DNA-binding MarR family transcriptional regulator
VVAPEKDVPTAELTEREIECGHRLAGAMFGLGKQHATLAHQMSKSGVDRSTIFLLKALAMHGPRRSSELATAVHSDPSTVSRQVAALVRDRLIERQADPDDGRASVLVPTERGLELLAEQRRRMGMALAHVIRQWDPEDVTRFLELFERFVADHERALPKLIERVQARSEGEN